ncbi:trehalose-phosphatase-domain-containing protein [Dunaliella salina]|uniref:Trehalose 6-phosphate phosphatase n=1 Tax=Dunaliella salina TaxID=3046 RepID=A0ABQ7GRL5_DUNSA|nr:trehalose-phosphatase-domain-containing protein [Dunaliella salina]|eukprot:KAF5837212.1 trehalose-phosphatase-domain-containing protein [Dunaliella salina]
MLQAGSKGEPQQLDTSFQPAAHFRPVIDATFEQLSSRLQGIPGASVEHNTFCVSAHFRNCAADRWHEVVSAVESAVQGNEQLRVTRGRKVLEVRPKVDWNKGTALEHLLDMLGLKGAEDVVTLYIGDDQTDEDAFRVLKDTDQGWGILVSKKPKETSARYTVRDPSEVLTLLQALVAWGRSEHNGWVQKGVAQQEQQQQQQQQQQAAQHQQQAAQQQQQQAQQQQQHQQAHQQQQHQQAHQQQQHQQAQLQHHQPVLHWHSHSQLQQQPQEPQSQSPQQPALEHPHGQTPFHHPHAQLQPPIPPFVHQHQQGWGAHQGQGFGRQSAGPPPPSSKKPNGFWCGTAAAAVSKGSAGAVGSGEEAGSHLKGKAAESSPCSNGAQ